MSKIALVTGASAGFGKAIVENLVADGYRVIASARRLEKLQDLQINLGKDTVYPLQMDISQIQEYPAINKKGKKCTQFIYALDYSG